MANRYWVGGSGNTNDTAHWSETSGGATGASVPTTGDNVFYDGNSDSAGANFTSTANATHTIQDLDITGIDVNPTFAVSGGTFKVQGNANLVNVKSPTFSTNFFTFNTQAGQTSILTPISPTLPVAISSVGGNISLADATATVQLGSNLSIAGAAGINISNGIFDTNGFSYTAPAVLTTSNGKLSLAGSTITFTNAATTALNLIAGSLTAGTSTIILTGASSVFKGGGNTFYDVDFQETSDIEGSNTFTSVTFTAGESYKIQKTTTQTITTLNAQGSSGSVITLNVQSPPGTAQMCVTNSNVDYVTVSNIDSSCGNVITNPNGTNGGGNTNWIFAHWWEGTPGGQEQKPQVDTPIIISSKSINIDRSIHFGEIE